MIMSAAMPFIVMTGMHWVFVPIALTALATPAIVAMPQFIGGGSNRNLIYACIAAVAAALLSFILTWIIGFDDPEETKDNSLSEIQKQNKQNSEIKPTTEIKPTSVTNQGQDSGQCDVINQGQDKEQCEAENQKENH